jgi:CBS domain-containing protein
MEARVLTVLQRKGNRVITVTPQQTIRSVVEVLNTNRIGAAPVVSDDGRLVGMVSERDVIRGLGQHAGELLTFPVDRLMTREVKTCSADDRLVDIMEVMTVQRIRHLPVTKGGALQGIISIGDVVKQRLEEVQSEVEDLQRYIRSP